LWESVMGSNPSHFKGANRPVVMVSWFDCVLFCNKLSELEGLEPAYDGLGDYQVGDDESMFEDEIDFFSEDITCNWTATGYRLPTEGEWEYSARANQNFLYAGSDNVDEVAWYGKDYLGDGGPGNSDGGTHPVGLKKPNGFGLYDMSGNVDEWVWDCFELNYYSSSPTVDPRGPNCDRDSGKYRLNRGGNCSFAARNARVSFRDLRTPNIKHLSLGFRPVRTP